MNRASGGNLSGTLTFAGSTLADLGVTPGSHIYSLPNDTIELRFSATTPVPEPNTMVLLLLGMGTVVALRRARTR